MPRAARPSSSPPARARRSTAPTSDLWQKDSGKSDLLALLDQATDALADAIGELQPTSRRRNPPAKPRSSRR